LTKEAGLSFITRN